VIFEVSWRTRWGKGRVIFGKPGKADVVNDGTRTPDLFSGSAEFWRAVALARPPAAKLPSLDKAVERSRREWKNRRYSTQPRLFSGHRE
jgi:hypothetical protein